MSALQAVPTEHGIDILNSELKQTVTKYQLIGALTHDAESGDLSSFHTGQIESSYFDENGVLTFILNLPIDIHFDEYLHRINVLDDNNQIVIECSTPKIALAKGIGGMVTLKAAISGQAGDVIFKQGEYVTETEFNERYLANMVGLIGEFHLAGSKPGWLDLKGGEFSRTTDKILWDYAQTTGLVIVQATKDANPMTYAMYFGEGDGETTFTLPNHHLGHFVRGYPSDASHGETQGDAIRPVESSIGLSRAVEAMSVSDGGVFSDSTVTTQNPAGHTNETKNSYLTLKFDISKIHPVANEVRPYTANLSIKIHRGWM